MYLNLKVLWESIRQCLLCIWSPHQPAKCVSVYLWSTLIQSTCLLFNPLKHMWCNYVPTIGTVDNSISRCYFGKGAVLSQTEHTAVPACYLACASASAIYIPTTDYHDNHWLWLACDSLQTPRGTSDWPDLFSHAIAPVVIGRWHIPTLWLHSLV